MDISDYLMRDSNMNRESLKSYIKGQMFHKLGEGIAEEHKDLFMVDTTKEVVYSLQGELWIFTAESLLEMLRSTHITHEKLISHLDAIVADKKVRTYKKELIKFEEL